MKDQKLYLLAERTDRNGNGQNALGAYTLEELKSIKGILPIGSTWDIMINVVNTPLSWLSFDALDPTLYVEEIFTEGELKKVQTDSQWVYDEVIGDDGEFLALQICFLRNV